jgi:serine/threonine-protein kinase
MSSSRSRNLAADPVTLTPRADQECDRFEAAWKAGQRPRLEDHLEAVMEADRPGLLRELILLEVDYRRLAGASRAGRLLGRRARRARLVPLCPPRLAPA